MRSLDAIVRDMLHREGVVGIVVYDGYVYPILADGMLHKLLKHDEGEKIE